MTTPERLSPPSPRYAVYWAPPAGSALWRFGSSWLGRDAEADAPAVRPPVAGFDDATLDRLTEEPRRYGFHGTMKPPFRLAEGCLPDELGEAALQFAAQQAPFTVPALALRRLGHFLALVPAVPVGELDGLAARSVMAFDRFRAPAGAAELAERRKKGLTARQDAYLVTWGYPYVLDEFRFHLTLSGRLTPEEAPSLEAVLAPLCEPFRAPQRIHEIAIFEEPAPKQPFRLWRRFPLGG